MEIRIRTCSKSTIKTVERNQCGRIFIAGLNTFTLHPGTFFLTKFEYVLADWTTTCRAN